MPRTARAHSVLRGNRFEALQTCGPGGKKKEGERSWRGTARAELGGSRREELIREAIHTLARESRADRVGVWLEQDLPFGSDPLAPASLRGLVWEAHADETPEEWEKLSLEPPLPQELLASGRSVDLEMDDSNGRPMIGPLVGLRQARWTPIEGKGRLRGVLLTGTLGKQVALHRSLTESVAAELALALEWEEEKRLARERQVDVRVCKQILTALGSGTSAGTILSRLAASCTEDPLAASGAGAAFAVIGHLRAHAQESTAPGAMEFDWESGNTAWTNAAQREPLVSLWRSAFEAGHVLGTEPPESWTKEGLARLVAIPLVASGEALGVLVAGIRQKNSSLGTLDRLELRASLAVFALQRRRLDAEQVRRAARRHALLERSPEATALLDVR